MSDDEQAKSDLLSKIRVGYSGISKNYVEPLKKYFACVEEISFTQAKNFDMYIFDLTNADETVFSYIYKHQKVPMLVYSEELIKLDEVYGIQNIYSMIWNPYVNEDYWKGESETDFIMFMEAFLDFYDPESGMDISEVSPEHRWYYDDFNGRAKKNFRNKMIWNSWKEAMYKTAK